MGLCAVWFGLTFQIIGMIANIVGVATSNWLVWTVEEDNSTTTSPDSSTDEEGLYRIGLFRFCSDALGDCEDFPHSLDHYHDIIEAAQASLLTGMGLGIVSVALSIWTLALFYKDQKRNIVIAMGILAFILSLIFTVGGGAIFFLKLQDAFDNWDLMDIGYSAFTCAAGTIMITIFGSIAYCGAGKSTSSSSGSKTDNPANSTTPQTNESRPNSPIHESSPTNQPWMNEGTPLASANDSRTPARAQSMNETRPKTYAQSADPNNAYPPASAQYGATQPHARFE